MKKITLSILFIASLMHAETPIALSAKVGTLGFGIDVTTNLMPSLNLRANINKGKVDFPSQDSDLTGKGIFELESAGVLLDYHPFENGFRLSSGLYYSNNKMDISKSGVENNILIGKHYYDLTTESKTEFSIDMSGVAPYVGIGWGDSIAESKAWSFTVDVGVLYQGSVDASISMSGSAKEHKSGKKINLKTDKTFLKDVKAEEYDTAHEMKGLEWYPVLSVGVAYRF